MTEEPDESTSVDPAVEAEPKAPSANWVISLVICAVILAVAGGLAYLTFITEPTAQRGGATKETAMLVDVVEVERTTERPTIVSTGTVQASEDIVLRPQVAGRIVERAPGFVPGGFIEKGDLLVKIEQADFRNTLAQRESALSEAIADLALEEGRQRVAKSEYEFYDKELSEEEQRLILRKPQLQVAKKRVEAARAAVEQARLNLARTVVRSPVDAHILRRDVNVGSQVTPNDSLGRLVGAQEYWVAIELPLKKLRWVDVPEAGDAAGAPIKVRNLASWPEDTYRHGELFRHVGMLGGDTRMAQVLATVKDPLAIESNGDKPSLIIGEFLEVTIEGIPIEGAVKLHRDYVRDGDTVWVMKDGELDIREVEIPFRDRDNAYVTEGLEDGDMVVTTSISAVRDGAPLRLRDSSSDDEGSAEGEGDSE